MVGLVGLAVFAFILYMVVRSYLHSDKFRALVAGETSKALDAEGEFEPLQWEGTSMYSKSFAADGLEDALFSRLKAHEVRAKVSLAGISRGVWEIPSVQIDRFDFVVSDDRAVPEESADDASSSPGGGGSSKKRGFFARMIPSKVEIQEIKVKNVNFNVIAGGALAEGRGMKVKLTPTSAADGYAMTGRAGRLGISGFPKFSIDEFNIRTGEERFYLDHAAMRFFESGKVQLSGDAKLGDRPEVNINGVLASLNLADVLAADWVKKFKGIVDGDFQIRSSTAGGGLRVSGRLGLRNGSLEAMPVLEAGRYAWPARRDSANSTSPRSMSSLSERGACSS